MVQIIDIRVAPEEVNDTRYHIEIARNELNIKFDSKVEVRVLKRSIDARKRYVVYQLRIEVYIDEPMPLQLYDLPVTKKISSHNEAVVVGAGPAGLFAALQLIKNNIKPTVYSNTELIDVPVIYAYPERWVAMQKEGFLRDVSGKIIAPLIVVNRTDVTKNRNVGRNLDGNLAQNVHVFERQFTNKNAYDNFNVLNNRQPVKEMMVVAHPDYVTITYELNIYADFVEQSNRILEAVQYSENSFWGDKNRYYFRVNIESFPTSVQYSAEEERTVVVKFGFANLLQGNAIEADFPVPRGIKASQQFD